MKNTLKYKLLNKRIQRFLLLLVVIFTQGILSGLNAQTSTITIQKKNITVKEVLALIEENSKVVFFYADKDIDLNRKLTLDVKNQPVSRVLEELFKNSINKFKFDGKQVYISKKHTLEGDKSNSSLKRSKVTGIVTDKKGEAIIGALIHQKGTKTATVTDIYGKFSMDLPEQSTLSISYMGYSPQEFNVGSLENVRIEMVEDIKSLNEVVVVGYGTQRKITLTGAVTSINTKEIKQSAVSNLSNALVGRLPGLIARQSSGEPGANGSSLRIRGIATFSGSSDPLIMVDGVARDGFQYIEPNEVETITVLKDASATAVYGVRGANGVILVTTKRGEISEKPKIRINVEKAIQTPMAMLNYLNSADYFRVYRKGLINDGRLSEAEVYTNDYISRYDKTVKRPDDYKYLYPDVDWKKEMLKSSSDRTVLTVDLSGGTKKTRYFISGSYMNEGGIYNHTEDSKGYSSQAVEKRFNFRSNLDLEINSWLTAELNLATIVRNRNYPGISSSDLFRTMKSTPSYVFPMMNPDGSISERSGDSNPYALLTQTGYQQLYDTYLQGTAGVNAKLDFILKGLSTRIRFSYDAQNGGGYTRNKSYTSYIYLGDGKYQLHNTGADFLGYSLGFDNWLMTMNPELFLNYNRRFGDSHNVSAMILYRSSSKSQRSGDAVGALPYRDQGFVGRMTYGYADRYFGEVNFGYNGSENFAFGKRYGFFPSASVSWVANNEEFMEGSKSWLDLLKIRASAGKVGNQDPGTRFAYQSRWNLSDGGYSFGDNYQNGMPGATESTTGNPDVTWETATKYNLGLDFSLKKGLLGIVADVFFERRTGIYSSSQDMTSGLMGLATYPKLNAGIVENKGFEFEISHSNRINKNLIYELKGSYTLAINKIVKCMEAPKPDQPWQVQTGRQIGEILTYVAQGYFQSYAEIAKSASQAQFGQMQPGDIRYQDTDGDGVITEFDKQYIGKVAEPTQIIGLSGQIQYKGFDMAVLFQGALGRYVSITGNSLFGENGEMRQIFIDYDNNYWTPENPNAKYPRAMSQKNNNNTMQSTAWLRNGDYLRLKNLEIGYTFPKDLTKKINIAEIRLYANGNNLVTWDHVKLFDPEEEWGSPNYPIMRTFNLGLSLTF